MAVDKLDPMRFTILNPINIILVNSVSRIFKKKKSKMFNPPLLDIDQLLPDTLIAHSLYKMSNKHQDILKTS